MNNLSNKNITELFEIGIALKEGEKPEFIAKIKTIDLELGMELESLLGVDPSEVGLNSATSELHKTVDQTKGIEIPDVIGKFTIQSLLGAGGMGIVYLGKRQDINQLVAVKVSNSMLPQGARAQAITHEAKILASLQHPNIASLVDWGTFGNQQHYVAMEYVDGLSISDYCQQNKLTVINRLKLFIQVIQAIDYAHSNLVIHRDIKPANILVDENGSPILIDFGVARLMQSETSQLQQTQGAALTPSYASPEQLSGDVLSIRSDIYSLGVVLFNLITTKQLNTNEDQLNIEKSLTQTLNQSSNSKTWKTIISKQKLKDIALVINKAIATDQNLRYHNAQAFGEDLQAILDVRPIKARAPSFGYRFKKFVARNRVASGIITLALISTIVASGFGAWKWKEAVKQRNEAEESKNQLVKYAVFLENIMKGMNVNAGGSANISMDKFMKRAVQLYRKEKDVSHYQMAFFASTLAGIYEGWGNFIEAESLYDLGLEHAKNSSEKLDDVGLLVGKALLHSSDLQYHLGQTAALKALSLIEQYPITNWKKPIALISLAYLYEKSGELNKSIKTSMRVINDSKSHKVYVAHAYLNKSKVQLHLYKIDEAIKNANKALNIFLDRYGEDSAQVSETKSLIYSMLVTKDIVNYNLKIQSDISTLNKYIFTEQHLEQINFQEMLAKVSSLKGNFNEAINFQNKALKISLLGKKKNSIRSVLVSIQLAKYQMLNNQTNAAISTLNKIDKNIFKKLAKHEVAKFYHVQTWINVIKNKGKAAKKSIVKAMKYLENSEYIDLLAENSFRTAQLAALEKDYQSCYDNAKRATEQAENLYPKTWQLPNAYRYLQDVCQQKLNGSDSKDSPYLQGVLGSPWKQETVITTKILNSQ